MPYNLSKEQINKIFNFIEDNEEFKTEIQIAKVSQNFERYDIFRTAYNYLSGMESILALPNEKYRIVDADIINRIFDVFIKTQRYLIKNLPEAKSSLGQTIVLKVEPGDVSNYTTFYDLVAVINTAKKANSISLKDIEGFQNKLKNNFEFFSAQVILPGWDYKSADNGFKVLPDVFQLLFPFTEDFIRENPNLFLAEYLSQNSNIIKTTNEIEFTKFIIKEILLRNINNTKNIFTKNAAKDFSLSEEEIESMALKIIIK